MLCLSAQAGEILQATSNDVYQAAYFSPLGQSFKAQDTAVKFAFDYRVINPSFSVGNLELKLLDGEGLSGATLGDVVFALPANYNGFYDIDFSSANLTIGQSYTAVLSIPDQSPYWGVALEDNDNPYADGRSYFGGNGSFNDPALSDLTFRVSPGTSPTPDQLPEPGSLAILGLGLATMAVLRRKNQA